MRLAFTNLACPAWSLEETAAAAARCGYEGVELRLLGGETITPPLPRAEVRRVREVLAAAGLAVPCLDTSLRIAQPHDDLVGSSRAFMELAAAWGAPYLRVFGGDPKVGLDDQGRERAVAQLRQLAELGEAMGVGVLLETHDVFARGRDVAEVLRAVDHPNAGALWDGLHPWRTGEDVEDTAAALVPWTRLFHVKDGRRRDDGSAELKVLGDGDVPTRTMLRRLGDGGYQGWLSVEWEKRWHPELEDPSTALPRHADALRALVAGL